MHVFVARLGRGARATRHTSRATRAACCLGLAVVLTACSGAPARVETHEPRATPESQPRVSRLPSSTRERTVPPSSTATRPAQPGASTTRTPDAPPADGSDLRAVPGAEVARTRWGPTRREVERARGIVERMRLPVLAGQVIVARYSGTAPPTSLVTRLHLGGVIVMGENIRNNRQLRRSNRALHRAVREAGRRWPLFVGVDQEGGLVARVQGSVTRFPTFMTAGAARRPALTREAMAASGAELADLGFTVVFAPVADVTSGPEDPTIGSRSAAGRPGLVARQVNAAVVGFRSSGILPVVKHFPGHGSVPADSHEELPVQDKTLRELLRWDLVPFQSAVDAGVPSVMVGHLDVRAVDAGTPSSLSPDVVHGLLRRRLGFRGLVVTDALEMQAVAARFGSARAAVLAMRAGNDVVLMPPDPGAAQRGIMRAVRQGRLQRERLEQAATRQIALLLHLQRADRRTGAGVAGEAASRRWSAAAVTMVQGRCRHRLVRRSVRAVGDSDAVQQFRAAASRAGLRTGSGTTVALLGRGDAPLHADVVVSTDTPYVLGRATARTAKLALYGKTPGAMRALVEVLLGRRQAPGRLPVHVPGVPRRGC